MNRTSLTIGVVAPIAFVLVLLVEGATRTGYSAWRVYGSNLATGPGDHHYLTSITEQTSIYGEKGFCLGNPADAP